MKYSEAQEMVYDSVFNGEYAATKEQEEAYYTLFPDTTNYPHYTHSISDEYFKGWGVRWHGRTFNARYKTEYFKNIDGRHITIVITQDDCTLMTDAQPCRSGITANVQTLEDIEMLLHYDGIDYDFDK